MTRKCIVPTYNQLKIVPIIDLHLKPPDQLRYDFNRRGDYLDKYNVNNIPRVVFELQGITSNLIPVFPYLTNGSQLLLLPYCLVGRFFALIKVTNNFSVSRSYSTANHNLPI